MRTTLQLSTFLSTVVFDLLTCVVAVVVLSYQCYSCLYSLITSRKGIARAIIASTKLGKFLR